MSISLRAAADGNSGAIQVGGTDRVTIDNAGNVVATGGLTANGNVGIGVTPSASWYANSKVIQAGNGLAIEARNNSSLAAFSSNQYINAAGNYTYLATDYATRYYQNQGQHIWQTAPSGTAGNPLTFTQAMTLDASGNLLVGGSLLGGRFTVYSSNTTNGNVIAFFGRSDGSGSARVYNVDGISFGSAAGCALGVNNNIATGRSINSQGTINASGADYAEYERNNGIKFAKGDIVGFKADGTLTNVFAEAIRFGVKSTDPSYVGGDTWGAEDKVGKRPEKTEDQTEEEFAVLTAEFEAKLEDARQLVDRVAYSGKVPVNVLGASPGDYIIATYSDGAITGAAVSDPDFAQYKKSVGRVNRILEDGRCEVAVMVH